MKCFYLKSILLLGIILGLSFTGCSKDDDENNNEEPKAEGSISGLTASVSGSAVKLAWADSAETGYNNYYEVFRAVEGEEFEQIENRGEDTDYTDRFAEFSTSYQYFVKHNDRHSDTISIETESQYQPYTSGGGARYDGYGQEATIEYLSFDWRVGEAEGIERIEYFRDGELIDEYRNPYDNASDLKDEDNSFEFGVDYTYKVVVTTAEGETYESLELVITPQRPEEENHEAPEAPEVVKVVSDRENFTIDVYITDVSERGNDFIAYYIELPDQNYSWEEVSRRTDEFPTDEEGNLIIKLDASEVTFPASSVWLHSKVKIENVNTKMWSEWSDWNKTKVF